MDLIKHTTEWVQGEVLQGKIMLVLGIIILIISIFIFKSDHEILKGMLIPIGLILLILFGAGGFQIIGRLAHISKVENVFAQNPKQAIQQEYEKAIKDNKEGYL